MARFPDPPPKGWVLSLSGGAARGFAFIGVLRALEELNIPIRAVAGCSMGALVGGLYAAGVPVSRMMEALEELRGLNLAFLFRPSFRPSGLTDGAAVMRRLEDLMGGDRSLSELPLPFLSVATDLRTGRVVVLREGSLLQAIRASIAIPGIFTPVEREDMLLVDGGLVEPIPLRSAREAFGGPILAVSVLTPSRHPTQVRPHLLDVLNHSLYIMQRRIVEATVLESPPEALLWMDDVTRYSTAQFDRARELAELGYRWMMARREALLRLREGPHPESFLEALQQIRDKFLAWVQR